MYGYPLKAGVVTTRGVQAPKKLLASLLLCPARTDTRMYNWSGSPTRPTLRQLRFENNSALDDGGGMYNWQSHPTVSQTTFMGNSAFYGGGMYNWQSHPIQGELGLLRRRNVLHSHLIHVFTLDSPFNCQPNASGR